ncbi:MULTISPECIES: hypothetical protein [unclassified Microbacterium]|uniref:hypothetical protein n=1 Tax=unclassified Microbacterium TaxID=2609290 RepID=UPI0024697831|nr:MULTISPECIES: hypothetical protein [unclassified Microbacterium]MDH5135015.1 hypothetical protein [Microbacterium sp. RD10]MDH5138611.1 hypothetical protein [Microbacterium sp. RD11]MDH5147008.1 hypothetical protein [Microbacterium sp. RD12]MDH5156666.1 hypothetical protein [Microbacterium sp. RD06]MDH5168144.1 hypothetical protein [Microbacterium sp. RD02]
MRTLTGGAITLTAIILAYILRRPALNWAFNNKHDQPETPDGWTPKMRTWKHGVLLNDKQVPLGIWVYGPDA